MLLVTMSTRYVKETTSLATIYPTDCSQYRYYFLGLMTGIVRRLQLGRRLPGVTSRSNSRVTPKPCLSLALPSHALKTETRHLYIHLYLCHT
ncbi:hypothetical protein VE01_10803 [Pseudogymnoascus verrucosus]|uniref:Uncharacterized protein n=1 Tax=Pseudogymnoascus verrucosus TaxID=342668 RepID=A0A2P6FGY7_9PEZI|nr:uncharacterized protein VE01_10803 [Pseudogymnoascus verrucosus]PQM43907.1 hypothetical protein VE01_10803 [Pseudogymnoascus verrucosus]